MALTVQRTSDITNVWLATVMYGPPKVGKTTFAAGLGKPLIVDFDDGLLSLRDLDIQYVQPRTWEEVLTLTTDITNGTLQKKVDFDHIIWDSHTMFYNVVLAGILQISKRQVPQIQDWGLANDRAKIIYDKMIKNRVEKGYHFTVICHEKIDKDDNTGRLVGGINATPALMATVPAMFDEMYYLTTSVGTDSGGKTVVKRSVWTVQNGFYPAGTRSAGRLLPVEDANFKSIYEKIVGGKT